MKKFSPIDGEVCAWVRKLVIWWEASPSRMKRFSRGILTIMCGFQGVRVDLVILVTRYICNFIPMSFHRLYNAPNYTWLKCLSSPSSMLASVSGERFFLSSNRPLFPTRWKRRIRRAKLHNEKTVKGSGWPAYCSFVDQFGSCSQRKRNVPIFFVFCVEMAWTKSGGHHYNMNHSVNQSKSFFLFTNARGR